MGTRADFYVGRGVDAEWLGSIAFDGDPDERLPQLKATDEAEFRACVENILCAENHATRPEQGWPWPWNDSDLTDYAYAWDEGQVWTAVFSRWWTNPSAAEEQDRAAAPAVFPDMKDRKNVTFGSRSGVIILGG